MDFTTSFAYYAGVTINSIGAGLLLGLLNWTFWHFGTKWLLAKKRAKRGVLAFLTLFKFGVVAGVIWILLTKVELDPIGFLLGFSITILATVTKSLRWN